MRRLLVYLLLDTSGSMQGEPIEAVNSGMETLVSSLRQDPYALETVHLSVLTFDIDVKTAVPITALEDVVVPQITTPKSGPTHLGEALQELGKKVKQDVVKSSETTRGDWAPYLFVMTDGKPSDTQLFAEQCEAVKKLGFASIIGCAAGPKAKEEELKKFCTHVVRLDTMDNSAFTKLFQWVSEVIGQGNKSQGTVGGGDAQLPPPPAEINLVM